MTYLLDGNVLIALSVRDHVHHNAAVAWWTSIYEPFATCPITQGALVRLLVRQGLAGDDAVQLLRLLIEHNRHVFWSDDVGYGSVSLSAVLGHAQVTDAYLAALARHRQGRLVTFDRRLAEEADDVAVRVPVD